MLIFKQAKIRFFLYASASIQPFSEKRENVGKFDQTTADTMISKS